MDINQLKAIAEQIDLTSYVLKYPKSHSLGQLSRFRQRLLADKETESTEILTRRLSGRLYNFANLTPYVTDDKDKERFNNLLQKLKDS